MRSLPIGTTTAPLASGSDEWWPSLRAHLCLARPADNAFAFIGTFLGAGLAGVPASVMPIVTVVATSNALLSAASMMVNDWHDVAEDTVNRPDRPIPSGLVPRHRALGMSALCFIGGIGVAAVASWSFGLAAAAVTLFSLLYTWKFKTVPFVGNGAIGILSAYPLWCWIAIEGFHGRAYLGAALGFLVAGTGREIVRTAADAAGDAARSIRTLATLCGGRTANTTGLVLILAGLVTASLSARADAGPGYLTALAIASGVMLVAGPYQLRTRPVPDASRRLTGLARLMTAVLASGVAWDLIAAGWALR